MEAARAGLPTLERVEHQGSPPLTPYPPTIWCRMPSPFIIDSHLDLAWNAIDWNRDLKLPVHEIRKREVENKLNGKGRGVGTVSFPDLRRGNVGLFIATLL